MAALREQREAWLAYASEIKTRFGTEADPEPFVRQTWRASDVGRRYFHRRMWTKYQWQLDLDPAKQSGPDFPKPDGSSREEVETYGDAMKTMLLWGFCESVYNTLANANEDARRNRQDAYPVMYQSLMQFLEHRVPVLRVFSLSAWNTEDAIASLVGLVAARGRVYPRQEIALAFEQHNNQRDGLLSELPAEIAPVLLNRLHRAEAGETPGDFDLQSVINAAYGSIGDGPDGIHRQTRQTLTALAERQRTLAADKAAAIIRLQEMWREAEAVASPGEMTIFRLMAERPDITEAEIAAELGVTVGTIKTQKSRLRAKLEKADRNAA